MSEENKDLTSIENEMNQQLNESKTNPVSINVYETPEKTEKTQLPKINIYESDENQEAQAQEDVPAETKVVDSLTLESLNDDEKQLIMNIVKQIDLKDSQSVLGYGVPTQNKIADFCNQILNNVKGNELENDVATILADLAVEIKNFDNKDEGKPGFLSGLFGGINKGAKKVGESFDDAGKQLKHQIVLSKKEVEKMQVKYETVAKTIDMIVSKLEQAKQQLIKNITVMDGMYNTNLDYYKELTYCIIAAKEKLKLFEDEIKAQQEVATQSNDQMEIQKLNEMTDIYEKFDKKIDDLTRGRLISIQNAPQIRLVQKGSEQLVYQIQNSILTAIPVWKSQMVISLGIANNKTALGLQKHISDTTNELLRKNSELLKQGALEIAEENEKGLVTIETLQTTNENLIQTINGVMEIQKRGKENRKSAEKELMRLENQIKETLLASSN